MEKVHILRFSLMLACLICLHAQLPGTGMEGLECKNWVEILGTDTIFGGRKHNQYWYADLQYLSAHVTKIYIFLELYLWWDQGFI